MRQIKTYMCFIFSQPMIGCPLLKGTFCPKYSRSAQKKCPLYQMSAIKASAITRYPLYSMV